MVGTAIVANGGDQVKILCEVISEFNIDPRLRTCMHVGVFSMIGYAMTPVLFLNMVGIAAM